MRMVNSVLEHLPLVRLELLARPDPPVLPEQQVLLARTVRMGQRARLVLLAQLEPTERTVQTAQPVLPDQLVRRALPVRSEARGPLIIYQSSPHRRHSAIQSFRRHN